MIENIDIEETLNDLIKLIEKDKKVFYQTYKSLPFGIYKEIERLSVSKSALFKSLCEKAKKVAETFHKSIK
jgi:hypothetical protein